MTPSNYQYENLKVDISPNGVAHVQLYRPKRLNAFNDKLFADIHSVFDTLSADPNVTAVVVSGSGRMFSAGLDLKEGGFKFGEAVDTARQVYATRAHIKTYQDALTAVEKCSRPVIAAIHNGCFGAGVDLITACDIRYASKDAFFCVKEVDVGLAADVGSLQRLPKIIGNNSLVRELCFTGRNIYADEALQCGLVNRVLDNYEKLIEKALETANIIASKSPVAVVGTKHLLNYSRDHSVAEGLEYTVAWNAGMLITEDIPKSVEAFVTKNPPKYSKL
ncbi:ClpP/crotonase-like domain-containing protein [Radiomyces spectabilis]|uniref:ClpP/crotonase-like domain-containing protein n=1 Tax=Radiomyces spectabilis TaxID=64574 RepID=UPI00221E60E1|nr:ClpP/crotonase-like domain-containing protein [Radiomyces spectabilis]KAI8366835.1 ClpP/crotonase-like domain-containing protein [Radiomyces spectabilis]